jgi:hypothetical protein
LTPNGALVQIVAIHVRPCREGVRELPDGGESREPGLLTPPRFRFEVDGVEVGTFRDFVGAELTSGSGECGVQTSRWPHLVLRRGVTERASLLAWLASAHQDLGGRPRPRPTAAVTTIDASGNTLREWEISEVFPIRWDRADVEGEVLEVAHRGVLPRVAIAPMNVADRR